MIKLEFIDKGLALEMLLASNSREFKNLSNQAKRQPNNIQT
jgi:hypothetical protein